MGRGLGVGDSRDSREKARALVAIGSLALHSLNCAALKSINSDFYQQ